MELNGLYTLDEIFFEFWKEEHEDDKEEFNEADVRSFYRGKLNGMFKALFDNKYENILIENKQSGTRAKYIISDIEKKFILFLLRTYKEPNGKALRNGRYAEIDREYENILLYYVNIFLSQRKKQECGSRISTNELKKIVIKKFNLSNEIFELIKALEDFKDTINKIIDNSKKENYRKKREINRRLVKIIKNVNEKKAEGIFESINGVSNEEIEYLMKLKEIHKEFSDNMVISDIPHGREEIITEEFKNITIDEIIEAISKTKDEVTEPVDMKSSVSKEVVPIIIDKISDEIINEAVANGIDNLADEILSECKRMLFADYM